MSHRPPQLTLAALLAIVLLGLSAASTMAQPAGGRGRGPAGGQHPQGGSANAASSPVAPEELIRMFDRNGDKKISREEAPERMRQRWEQIDTDHDGFVSLAELQARDARVGQGGGAPERSAAGAGPSGAPRTERGARFAPAAPFSVIILGSGSPQYTADRSGPCAVVQHQGNYILVDMGTGTQARLSELGLVTRQLNALLLTHHHLDHNAEFIPLFLHTQLLGVQPAVIGPPSTAKLVDFTLNFYAEDIAYRLRRVGRSTDELQRPAVRELQGGESFSLGSVRVSTARVNHTIHTVAYRFDAAGQSIVISGDLSYTEALVKLAHNADVLVLDSGGAIVRTGETPREGHPAHEPRAAIGATVEGLAPHASAEQVLAMAQKSSAKRLVLTHIGPGEVDTAATIGAFSGTYRGEVIVARDFLEVPASGAPRLHATGGTTSASATPAAAEPSAGGIVPAKITGRARVYVNAACAERHPDGKTWSTAFPGVQAGMDAAQAQGGGEVWVAAGVYKPTASADRNATFQLRPGVAVYGGFTGVETEQGQRDWQRQRTTLSGDIGRADVATDNCYHVVTGADNALLDGFLITGGYGLDGGGAPGPQGPPQGPPAGGAPGSRRGVPGRGAIHTTPDAILTGSNRSFGAGMLNFQSAPTVQNCAFQGNQAGKGGAAYNMVARSFPPRPDAQLPAPLWINCRFFDNHARGRGGAMANDLGSSPTLQGCLFVRNSCAEKGGAIYNDFGCSPTLANCLFAENRAATAGAVGNDGGSSPHIVHCTFAGNTAQEEGAALYQGTGPANSPRVRGCIFWDNRCANGPADIFNWHDNDPQVTDSCIQNGYSGEGNFSSDPRFIDPAQGDYRPGPDTACKDLGYSAVTPAEWLVRSTPAGHFERPQTAAPESKARPHDAQHAAEILHVNAAHTGANPDGHSWQTAFSTLAAALEAAGTRRVEIWVAAGIYKPTAGADRSAAFRLPEGVQLYGGFNGRETARAKRDPRANLTVLSGDIGRPGDPADNAYHVLVGANDALVDGFVIRDGNADGTTYDGKGGGLINYRRAPQSGPMGAATGFSPVVRHCTFTHNHAREGGAVYNYDRGTPQFANCLFAENMADYGGALVDRVGVRSTLTDCQFSGNTARWRGGAVYLDYGARPTFTQCRFENNRSEVHGGALATVSRASQLENTIPLLQKCTFSGNAAGKRGGAIANSDSSAVGLEACVFADNQAGAGGGAVANDYRGRVVLLNCRFAGNRTQPNAAELTSDESSTTSSDRSQWPDQTPAATPARFGPPPR